MQKIDRNIGLQQIRHFCRKLGNIAENFDNNIDPGFYVSHPGVKLAWNFVSQTVFLYSLVFLNV
jgi:hypothetical protein